MLLGHIAVAAIAKQTVFHERRFSFLFLASFAPDIIDKSAQLLFGLPGRGIGHSLLFFAAASILLLGMASRYSWSTGVLSAGLVMWFTHLMGDFPRWQVLFWPFYTGVPEPYPRFDFFEKLYQFYVIRAWPEQFWLEMFCIAAAITICLVRLRSGRTLARVKES